MVAAGEMSFGCSSLFGTEGFSLLLPGVGQSLVKEGFPPTPGPVGNLHDILRKVTKKKRKKNLSYNYLSNGKHLEGNAFDLLH